MLSDRKMDQPILQLTNPLNLSTTLVATANKHKSTWHLYISISKQLTRSTPAVPNFHCSKGSVPYWSNPAFLIFDIRALWRSSTRMSKIKNRGLDQYGKE